MSQNSFYSTGVLQSTYVLFKVHRVSVFIDGYFEVQEITKACKQPCCPCAVGHLIGSFRKKGFTTFNFWKRNNGATVSKKDLQAQALSKLCKQRSSVNKTQKRKLRNI